MKSRPINHLAAGLTVLVFGLCATATRAQSDRPPPERWRALAEFLERQAGEFKQLGKLDQAEKAVREAREVRQHGEEGEGKVRPDGDTPPREKTAAGEREGGGKRPSREGDAGPTLEQMRAALRAELAAGHEDAAAEIKKHISEAERQLAQRREAERDQDRRGGREDGAKPSPGDQDVRQRLQHLHEATEHLRAAGLNEVAEKVAAQYAAMLQRVRAEKSGPDPELPTARGDKPSRPQGGDIDGLRREVQTLREQIQMLSRRLEESQRK